MTLHALAKSVVFSILLTLLLVAPCAAYIGPGAGLTAIGALLAVIAGVVVALFGFIWYPIKRLMRRRKNLGDSDNEGT